MSSSEQKRAVLAILLSGLVLFVWQAYFAPKTPISPQTTVTRDNDQETSKQNGTVEKSVSKTDDVSTVKAPDSVSEAKTHVIEIPGYKFNLLSDLTVSDIKSKDAVFPFLEIAGAANPFQIKILTTQGPMPLHFEIKRSSDGSSFNGTNEAYGIEVFGGIDDKGMFGINLKSEQPYRYQFLYRSSSKELENRQSRQFIYFSNDAERIDVDDVEKAETKMKWFGVDFDYHLIAFVFQEKLPTRFETDGKGQFALETIDSSKEVSGHFVFTKKNYDTLVSMGDKLDLSVDFGILGIISVPILRCLQWFYKFFPNYGVAIILLTLLIRMILFPLSYTSFKSMKKMQKIQPELAKLKEKFKDDQARMQKETMELFKKAGANPLGGCLPMLLQMPIFFAFYRVLYGAVELVDAPFVAWITDLSVKDPMYVLPVFMTMAMFLQQKLTPTTTADPTQKKIMMFMPLIFGFIMKDLRPDLTCISLSPPFLVLVSNCWSTK